MIATVTFCDAKTDLYIPFLLQGIMGRGRGCGKRFGMFLFFAYLLVKCLYIANAIGLIFILNTMLGKQALSNMMHCGILVKNIFKKIILEFPGVVWQ